jgi:SulP family sulfate permease
VVVFTHDLARGVLVGVVLSGVFFALKVGRLLKVDSTLDEATEVRSYLISGQVFFASADDFVAAFDVREVLKGVRIDLRHAHFWDITAVGALDKVVLKFRRAGVVVEVLGLNEASATMVSRFGVHDKITDTGPILGH